MQPMTAADTRALLISAALVGAAMLFIYCALELLRETEHIQASVTKADLAASEVWKVLREASDITRRAAEEGPGRG